MCLDQRVHDLYKHIDNVVQFEYPNESYFGSSSEYVIVWDLSLFTGVVQLLICCQFHQIVILRDEQFFQNELI